MARRTVVRDLQASKNQRKNMNAKLEKLGRAILRGQPDQQQYDQLMKMKNDLDDMEHRLRLSETIMWVEEGQVCRAEKDIANIRRKIGILVDRGVMPEERNLKSA